MLELDLPPLVLRWLADQRADRAGARADRAAAAALLEGRGFPAHAAVLDFEAAYGGLRVFDAAADPAVPSLVVGPYGCFSAGPYTGHERDLVPVIFGVDDTIYTLDAAGRGWVCAAMVEGVSRPSARDGRQLLTQAILWRALVAHPAGFDIVDGAHGASRAATRGLPVIADATCDDDERWWGDAAQLVVEIPRGNGYPGPMTFATR